jgi:hypothetical protein
MDQLLMPSDVKAPPAPEGRSSKSPETDPLVASAPVVEPPSVKLIVRLFLIPLFIVAAAVGVMFLIGRLAGGTPTTEELLTRLRNPGGARTADVLIGPGSKQRFLDAKALTDTMKGGMTPPERVKLSRDLIEILDKHTTSHEGKVRHFLLLALGRVWQRDAHQSESPDSADTSAAARGEAVAALLRYADSPNLDDRKAAILALAYLAGHEELRTAFPTLIKKVTDQGEDLDTRLAAATVLGPVATPQDADVIAALQTAMRDPEPRNSELVWGSALSLAQLGQRDVEDTILKLLSRDELSKLDVYDRETDPKNPVFRKLSEQEQERYLINTMQGARKLASPVVDEQMRVLAEKDPSARVRYAAKEILQGGRAPPDQPK